MRHLFLCALLLAPVSCAHAPRPAPPSTRLLQVSAPATTDIAGRTAALSRLAVTRVQCLSGNRAGTAFATQFGTLITAAHVITPCPGDDVEVTYPSGERRKAVVRAIDSPRDLALLSVEAPPPTLAFHLEESTTEVTVGSLVCTWGYPEGYDGLSPLLSVGYLSGSQTVPLDGPPVKQWVVNGAFNPGNSGGPLILLETGRVIGVVSNKLLPFPDHIRDALELLKKPRGGVPVGTKRLPDGTEIFVFESGLLAELLDYVRQQAQFVVGRATTAADLRLFLAAVSPIR